MFYIKGGGGKANSGQSNLGQLEDEYPGHAMGYGFRSMDDIDNMLDNTGMNFKFKEKVILPYFETLSILLVKKNLAFVKLQITELSF